MLRPLFATAFSAILGVGIVHAEPYQTFEVREGRKPVRVSEFKNEITASTDHLDETVFCGGWIDNEELQSSTLDNMTRTPGVPGRGSESFADIASGMGVQRGAYEFPDETYGYLSACNITLDEKYNPDKLCLPWELTATPNECRNVYTQLINRPQPQPYRCTTNEENPRVILFEQYGCYEGLDANAAFDPNSPLYPTEACIGTECIGGDASMCGWTYTCHVYGNMGRAGAHCTREPRLPDENGTCPPMQSVTVPPVCEDGAEMTQIFEVASFYRHYGPITDFNKLPQQAHDTGFEILADPEVTTQRGAADCYEYYVTKDAKTKPAEWYELKCELYETRDSDDDGETPEWKPENLQHGEIKPNTNRRPYQQTDLNPDNLPREETEQFIYDKETNLTLVDSSEFPNNASFSEYVSHILNIPTESSVRAANLNIRNKADAFDDASTEEESRVFSLWWIEQQRELAKRTQLPAIRVVLPAPFAVGLDKNDPLIKHAASVTTRSDGAIEIELRAGDDTLGDVLTSLRNFSLLAPREVKLPVVVPVLSEQEINALISDWKLWEIEFDRQGEADPIVERLNAYKEQVSSVRLLRGGITTYLSGTIEAQKKIRGFFADWYITNADRIQQWTQRAKDGQLVQNKWKELNAILMDTVDRCELKWCSNARYTTPIYTLLDPWLRQGQTDLDLHLDEASVTEIPWQPEPDIVIDFSSISIPQEYFYLPVLEVTQVRVDAPRPPNGDYAIDEIAGAMPDIPVIPYESLSPEFSLFSSISIPDVALPQLNESHYIPPPPTQQFEEMLTRMQTMQTMFDQARYGYCLYTDSIHHRNDGSDEAQIRKIVHTEYDLRERMERAFARKSPLRAEDYAGRETRRERERNAIGAEKPPVGLETACGDDVICETFPPEKTTSFKWQLSAPKDSAGKFEADDDTLRNWTLPPCDKDDPAGCEWLNPYDVPREVLERHAPAVPLTDDDRLLMEVDLGVQSSSNGTLTQP